MNFLWSWLLFPSDFHIIIGMSMFCLGKRASERTSGEAWAFGFAFLDYFNVGIVVSATGITEESSSGRGV